MSATRVLLTSVARIADRVATLLLYVSAATVPFSELQSAQVDYWSDFSIADDDIDRGWFGWERDVVARFVRPGMRVLLVGCGSGRDLIQLLRAGCVVTGIDMAEAPLRRAEAKLRSLGLTARLIHARAEHLPAGGTYDVVWFSWLSYGYMPMTARRVATLAHLRPQLAPGGVVVVNVLRGRRPTRAIAMARWVGRLAGSDWRLEQGDEVMRHSGGDRLFYQHLFAPGDAERELADAGLDRITSLHDGTVLVAAAGQEGANAVAPASATG